MKTTEYIFKFTKKKIVGILNILYYCESTIFQNIFHYINKLNNYYEKKIKVMYIL